MWRFLEQSSEQVGILTDRAYDLPIVVSRHDINRIERIPDVIDTRHHCCDDLDDQSEEIEAVRALTTNKGGLRLMTFCPDHAPAVWAADSASSGINDKEILVWRRWNVDFDGMIFGMWGRTWPAPIMQATCNYNRHDAGSVPDEDCCCGIYGLFRREAITTIERTSPDAVVGLIQPVGKTIVGPKGLRTETAIVRAAVIPDGVKVPSAWRDTIIITHSKALEAFRAGISLREVIGL